MNCRGSSGGLHSPTQPGGFVAADARNDVPAAVVPPAGAIAPGPMGADLAGGAERLRRDRRPWLRTAGCQRPSLIPAADALDLLEAPDLAVLPAGAA